MDQEGLEQAVLQSLTYLRSRSGGNNYSLGSREISNDEILESLTFFLEIIRTNADKESRLKQIKTHFNLFRTVQNEEPLPLLLTGYYEPTLQGSRNPSPRFRYPVYRLPDDLLFIDLGNFSKKYQSQKLTARIEGNQVIPYYSRKEIDLEGRLAGKNLEILWVDDLLKLFFMHIQGSGQVVLEDGSPVKLGYHATNGHPYYAIGRELIRQGVVKPGELSLQKIYAYLQDHPEEQGALLNLNPSYIFFQEVQGGPFGSLGFPLTPGRSVAADYKVFPPASLAWLEGWKPQLDDQKKIRSWVPFGRWVCLQDSGGAIKGPSRVDLFWGNGEEAEIAAGHLRHQGTIFLLLKKENKPDS
ncbi:MAG: MltA domain-containing protein [Deltaproteobacteria bacterium]|nr:MltA domain-containing protein [Deltaproteobacteria bacterium]